MGNFLNKKVRSSGFTLIEVVIVLAIGALIIMVVLNAVGAAQRNQRDSARRAEGGRIVTALEQYAANNNGRYPSSAGNVEAMLGTYESDDISDKWSVEAWGTCDIDSHEYIVQYDPASNNRDYDLKVCLEVGEQILKQ